VPKFTAVNAIPITEQVSWCGLEGEGFDNLLGGPLGCRMFGHIEMHDATSFVGQHDEDIENTKRGGGDGEEINGDKVGEVIVEKGPPRLGWGFAVTNHIFGHGCLGDLNIEFEQLSVNLRGSPQGVGPTHASDEFAYLGIEGGTAESLHAAFPGPITPEPLLVPMDDGLGLHNEERLGPVPPES
jgi:hypothetical protein